MKGLIEIFYAPGKVFDYVRERRAWLIPFLAGLVLFGAMYSYTVEQIGAGNITRHAFENSKFAANMTAEQKETAIAQADTPAGKGRTLAFTVVGYVVVTLVFALLFLAIAGVGGGPIKFSQALGTVAYSGWPIAVVRSILTVLVISLATDKSDLDPQRLLAFNAGAFLDKATTAKPLFALASAFDIITFAQMALAAYGLSKVARISMTKALTGIVLIWIVFTVLGMGLSLIF